MNISAALVKELRTRTGAGMMDCKQALIEGGGEMERAEETLKARGFAIAKKREERVTNQGRIFGQFSDEAVSLLELRCETDFVSQNAEFLRLGEAAVREVHDHLLTAPNDRMKALMVDTIALIRENLVYNSIHTLTAGPSELLAGYVHGIGKIASAVKLGLSSPELRSDPRVRELAGDLALHVTAFAPQFVSPEEISEEYREGYLAEYRQELAASGKPERLWDQIVAGKWAKQLATVCLVNQPYLRDEEISVAEALDKVERGLDRVERELGATIRVLEFAYIAIAPAVCL